MSGFKSLALCVAVASALMLPQVAKAADDLGVAAIQKHDWATAEQQLREGLQREPGNAYRQLNLAWVFAQTGRKAEAAALYREILRHDQNRVASLPSSSRSSFALLAEKGLSLLNKN